MKTNFLNNKNYYRSANAPERCLKTSTSTGLVFNVTLDMMAPINSKKQYEIKGGKKCTRSSYYLSYYDLYYNRNTQNVH